jgi:FkbM family methyltransferase
MVKFIKILAAILHRSIRHSRILTRVYFYTLCVVMKRLPDTKLKEQIVNSLHEQQWHELNLPPCRVTLGLQTQIHLIPHLKEFDFYALVLRQLNYEREVFSMLEARIPAMQYDAIVEIGANVGVYTVFFQKALQTATDAAIFAFEPSQTCYQRLQANLSVNNITGQSKVFTYQCAVSDLVGFTILFEPEGHLTNASLSRNFAANFSTHIQSRPILSMDGQAIYQLLAKYQKLLIKIDVEGMEARVLRTLQPVIEAKRNDIIVEVLEGYTNDLNQLDFIVKNYDLYNITIDGLIQQSSFVANPLYRDYLLTPK